MHTSWLRALSSRLDCDSRPTIAYPTGQRRNLDACKGHVTRMHYGEWIQRRFPSKAAFLSFSLSFPLPPSLKDSLSGESLSARYGRATFDLYVHKSSSVAAIRRPSNTLSGYFIVSSPCPLSTFLGVSSTLLGFLDPFAHPFRAVISLVSLALCSPSRSSFFLSMGSPIFCSPLLYLSLSFKCRAWEA